MAQSDRVSDNGKGLRKMSSVIVVVAMVTAGLVAAFAFSSTNVVAVVDLTVTGTDMVPSVGLYPGELNITMLWLTLQPADEAVGVSSMTFDLTPGSVAGSEVTKIFLFDDYDGNKQVDENEMQFLANYGILSSVNNPTFPQTMTLSGYSLSPSTPRYILVLINIATGTEGQTVGVELTSVSCTDPTPTILTGSSSDADIKYVIWSDDMESGVGSWTQDGQPEELWHMTSRQNYYISPTNSWWYGNETTEWYLVGTVVNSKRNAGNLTSGVIDISGYSAPAMSFWHIVQTENWPGNDECRLFIEDTSNPGIWNELGLWIDTENWTKQSYDLAAYAGKSVRLRFFFDTIDGLNNLFTGWFVDDIYFFGSQEANDIATQDFKAPNYALPTDTVYVNATIANLGQSAEDNATNGITVWLRIDGVYDPVQNIPSIPQGGSQPVSFQWVPGATGDYEVCIHAWPVAGETATADNLACKTVKVRDVPAKKVAVVRSYGTKYGGIIQTWVDLNQNWESWGLGVTPIEIDWDSLNKTGITYADIVASGADTLVISASAAIGVPQSWSELSNSEITAIKQYTLEGHGLVATATTFYYPIPTNNDLTDMFGIVDQDYNFTVTGSDNSINKINPAHALFTNVPADPFVIGNNATSLPNDDDSWDAPDLRPGSLGGQYLAKSAANDIVLVEFKKLVYFSWLPEWFGNMVDKQLLYNALVWSQYQTVAHDVAVSNLIGPDRVKPSPTMDITATITNLATVVEDNGTRGIDVLLTQDGLKVDQANIPSLGIGASQDVTLTWDPPDLPVPQTYNICMKAWQVAGELDTTNNEVCKSIEVIDPGIIIVGILDSWGTENPGMAPWDDINTNWASYGPYPILIDYTTLAKEDITLLDLVYSSADVLLISSSNSTMRSTAEFTPAEISAIQTYVETMGHGIAGTGRSLSTFFLPTNNQLAPLFGIDSSISFGSTSGVTTYQQLSLGHTVFYEIPDPFTTVSGISCNPGGPSGWNPGTLLSGAEYLGNSTPAPSMGAIVGNNASTHKGIYLSNFHEMSSSTDDTQILYNSMMWVAGRTLYPEMPPPPPENLWISVQGSQLRLDWTVVDPQPDIWFNIFRANTVDGFNFAVLHGQVPAPPFLDPELGPGTNANNYFYVVRAINLTSSLTENNTVKVGKFFNLLHKGTNDVSIPFELQFTSVDVVFVDILADITDVMAYDSATATWLSYGGGTLTDVDNTMGLRVISTKNNLGFITVGRVPVTTVMDLTIGLDQWFFVGYPNFKTNPLPDILDDNGLAGLYDLVLYYDPTDRKSPWKWFDPNDPDSPLTELETGKGYWIHMLVNGTWTVPGE